MARAWCKHYRGMSGKTQCEAGVEFASLPNRGTKEFTKSCPCFGPDQSGTCEKAEYPTAEEMAAEDREIEERCINLGKARRAIVEHLGGPWTKGTPVGAGEIDCPVCGKTLKFTRSGYNGHIHARCETDGCVSWME